MKTAQDRFEFRLGVFVIAGVLLGVGLVLAIGLGRYFQKTLPLYCYFQESVQGLEQGSEIKYRGVRIGRVQEIRMRSPPRDLSEGTSATGGAEDAIIEVKCEIEQDALVGSEGDAISHTDQLSTYCRRKAATGLRVRLVWKGITGEKYLEVETLDPKEYPPPRLPVAVQEPYLPTAMSPSISDIQRDLATTLGHLARIDYATISDRVVTLLEKATQEVEGIQAGKLSAEAQELLGSLRELAGSDALRNAVTRADRITERLESASTHLDELLSREDLGQAVTDIAEAAKSMKRVAEALDARLPATLDAADATLATAKEAIEASQLPQTAESLRGAAGDVASAARNVGAMREDLRRALRDIADAGRQIGRLARFLEEHPEALITGRRAPPQGEQGGNDE